MEFLFLCSSLSSWTLEDKRHIYARRCIILYLLNQVRNNHRPVEFFVKHMLPINTPKPIQEWLSAETVNTTQSKMSCEIDTYFRVIFPEQKRGQGDQT